MANVIQKNSISAELAQKMVDAALAKANAIGVAVNVAILDDGGNLKAFSRMDGAPILSIEIAQNKAYTALFGLPTQDFFNFTGRAFAPCGHSSSNADGCLRWRLSHQSGRSDRGCDWRQRRHDAERHRLCRSGAWCAEVISSRAKTPTGGAETALHCIGWFCALVFRL